MKRLILITVLALLMTATALQIGVVKTTAQTVSPLTSPITYYAISGRVGYKLFLQNGGQILPAKGALVIARNIQSNEKKIATTSATGSYSILVTPGTYSVRASDYKSTQFKPTEYILNIVSSDATKIAFLGIIR